MSKETQQQAVEFNAWRARVKAMLAAILAETPDVARTKRFVWHGKVIGSLLSGFTLRFSTDRDLTAAILDLVVLAHPSGDCSNYNLKELIGAAGPLWDRAVEDAVWPHLKVSA